MKTEVIIAIKMLADFYRKSGIISQKNTCHPKLLILMHIH